jgi:hypothetical protein
MLRQRQPPSHERQRSGFIPHIRESLARHTARLGLPRRVPETAPRSSDNMRDEILDTIQRLRSLHGRSSGTDRSRQAVSDAIRELHELLDQHTREISQGPSGTVFDRPHQRDGPSSRLSVGASAPQGPRLERALRGGLNIANSPIRNRINVLPRSVRRPFGDFVVS